MNVNINGPINIVRLSKKNGKILYLFFDIHEDISNQTECNTNNNIDIVNYFHETFSKVKNEIDFFIEASPVIFTETNDNIKKENYIDSLQKWVTRNFNYDKNRDKVMNSRQYPNVRFHYFDFRQYFDCLEFKDIDIYSFLNIFTQNMSLLYKMLKSTSFEYDHKKPILMSEIKNEEIRKRFMYKLLNRYSQQSVKKTLLKYINKSYVPHIKKSLDYVYDKFPDINKVNEVFEEPNNKLNTRGYGIDYEKYKKSSCFIDILANKVVNMWLDSFVFLVDIYFLRRFLDKKYIKTGVMYAGAFHCLHIILVLVKYFDYEITNAFYTSVGIKKVNKIIKDLKVDDPYQLMEYLWTPYLFQCSNLKDFPEF